jgi:hypothetical protein
MGRVCGTHLGAEKFIQFHRKEKSTLTIPRGRWKDNTEVYERLSSGSGTGTNRGLLAFFC